MSQFILLIGHQGSGKTALAADIVKALALDGHSAVAVDAEQVAKQWWRRSRPSIADAFGAATHIIVGLESPPQPLPAGFPQEADIVIHLPITEPVLRQAKHAEGNPTHADRIWVDVGIGGTSLMIELRALARATAAAQAAQRGDGLGVF